MMLLYHLSILPCLNNFGADKKTWLFACSYDAFRIVERLFNCLSCDENPESLANIFDCLISYHCRESEIT
jgi:hypothetical protein